MQLRPHVISPTDQDLFWISESLYDGSLKTPTGIIINKLLGTLLEFVTEGL